ncbi:hypothetical protein BD626DRAFT_566376 [Schizophyllum amplum]|uniref:Fe2OG dioxygenase domain-containing protein n=1 Tax=Schizophyllum amplum TaxID=97359 RepID=A0A550CLR0_9AGAR|nr:hypothetical protein BD626DRAFT_566376 [Auriculariopsis ampla]
MSSISISPPPGMPYLVSQLPPATAKATHIDFSQTPLAGAYTGFYATVVDDAFTPAEHTTRGRASFRVSERILRIDAEAADVIYARLAPFVDDITELRPGGKWAAIAHRSGRVQGPVWRLARVNPRLSFLRYGPGQYFQRHCDGLVSLEEDGRVHKSFVTLHLYLSDDKNSEEGGKAQGSLAGGATRFWAPDKKHFLDVEPRVGRVLIFQQRMLVHSGEPVTGG